MSRQNDREPYEKTIAVNRKARHDYEVLETYEAGLVLTGSEIKSIRDGRVNLRGGYARIRDNEFWLLDVHISPYKEAGEHYGHEPGRPRKLLLHRREIRRLIGKLDRGGLTLIPLRLYIKGRWAKVELGLCRGRREYDRREAIAKRQARRDIERAWKDRYR
ncbi:MAG: SsrA-binding protein SmpB [Chloroflexia bacterium]|nr:SsrA-binding protein SmpB [Chloroflexia bacterium]